MNTSTWGEVTLPLDEFFRTPALTRVSSQHNDIDHSASQAPDTGGLHVCEGSPVSFDSI